MILNILIISHSIPYNLHASEKKENKGLLLSITKLGAQILGENLIQTVVAIFEVTTMFPHAKQYCASYNSATEAPDWAALPFLQPPHFQMEHMVFSFIALHPHSRGFSGKARRNELPPWCFHPCSMIFELISIVYFMHKAFDCSPQEALMLLIYLSSSTQFSFFFDLTVCILAFKCSFFCQCIPVACL